MSDSSQGEGWWFAGNGKWYPPHLRPDVWADDADAAEAWRPATVHTAGTSSPSSSIEEAAPPTPDQVPGRRATLTRSRWWLLLGAFVIVAAAAAGTTIALSGDGNHEAKERPALTTRPPTPVQRLERAAAALQAARSVRVISEVQEPGGSLLQSDFIYLSDGDVSGSATASVGPGDDLVVAFREVGRSEYFFGPEAMWVGDGYRARVARSLADRWVVAPLGAVKDVVAFSLSELSSILTGLGGEQPTTGADGTVVGVPCVAVDTSVGTLWIARGGSSRPVELAESAGSGLIQFVAWNDPATIQPPVGAVRLPPA